jgi:hypothetical protein
MQGRPYVLAILVLLEALLYQLPLVMGPIPTFAARAPTVGWILFRPEGSPYRALTQSSLHFSTFSP